MLVSIISRGHHFVSKRVVELLNDPVHLGHLPEFAQVVFLSALSLL